MTKGNWKHVEKRMSRVIVIELDSNNHKKKRGKSEYEDF